MTSSRELTICQRTKLISLLVARSFVLGLTRFTMSFFSDFSEHYGSYKRAIDLLATLDCLLSLARVAKMHGYVW